MMPPYDLTRITLWSVRATVLFGLCLALLSGAILVEMWVLAQAQARALPVSSLVAADTGTLILSSVFVVVMVGTFAVNGIWIYRATTNANAIRPSSNQISAGWAVGWFFVPIFNLFKPYQSLAQTWHKSHGDVSGTGKMPLWFTLFWMAWITTLVVGQVTDFLNHQFTLLFLAGYLAAANGLIGIFCTVMFLRYVRSVHNAQRDTQVVEEVFA